MNRLAFPRITVSLLESINQSSFILQVPSTQRMKPWVVKGSMWQCIRLHLMLTRSKRQSASCRVSKPPRRPKELWRWCQCWLPMSLEASYAPWQTDTPRTFGTFLISHCRSITTCICYNVFKSISCISALQTNLKQKCAQKMIVTVTLQRNHPRYRKYTDSTEWCEGRGHHGATLHLGNLGMATRPDFEPRKKTKTALLSSESWLF